MPAPLRCRPPSLLLSLPCSEKADAITHAKVQVVVRTSHHLELREGVPLASLGSAANALGHTPVPPSVVSKPNSALATVPKDGAQDETYQPPDAPLWNGARAFSGTSLSVPLATAFSSAAPGCNFLGG